MIKLTFLVKYDKICSFLWGENMVDIFSGILDINDKSKYIGKKRSKVNTKDIVNIYLKEIGRYPLLSEEDEIKYGKIIKENPLIIKKLKDSLGCCDDKDQVLDLIKEKEAEIEIAKQIMINCNLRLVVSIAKRYVGNGLSLLDLIQEGNFGLIRAVERFDYTKGFKFSTYATWWIRQAVTRGLDDKGRTVRLPVHVIERINKLKRIQKDYFDTFHCDISLEELAYEADLNVSIVKELLKYDEEPASLNDFVGVDNDTEIIDFIEDNTVDVENEVFNNLRHEYVLDMFRKSSLNIREKFILLFRYGFSREDIVKVIGEENVADIELSSKKRNIDIVWGCVHTYNEIAEIYGSNREFISKIDHTARRRMKRYLELASPDLVEDPHEFENYYESKDEKSDFGKILSKIFTTNNEGEMPINSNNSLNKQNRGKSIKLKRKY